MSVFELRVYTLKDEESLTVYKDQIYPRHLRSAPPFDITPHGIWTSPDEDAHKLYVLVSHPDGTDPEAVAKAYMASPQFLDDIQGMDISAIVNVESVRLEPSTGSPLR